MVYNGFGNLNLVTERLGEFWTDYEILDDGNDLLNMGIFLTNISKPYEARKCLEKAKEIFKRNHDNFGISYTIHNLGMIHQQQGNYEEAVKKYNQSLKIEEELGDKSGIAITLHQIGRIDEEEGEWSSALRNYFISLSIFEKLNSPNKEIVARSLSRLRDKMGEEKFEEAYQELESHNKQF